MALVVVSHFNHGLCCAATCAYLILWQDSCKCFLLLHAGWPGMTVIITRLYLKNTRWDQHVLVNAFILRTEKKPTFSLSKFCQKLTLFRKLLSWPFETHIPSPMLSMPFTFTRLSSLNGLGSTWLPHTIMAAIFDWFVYLCSLSSPVSWKTHQYWIAPHN